MPEHTTSKQAHGCLFILLSIFGLYQILFTFHVLLNNAVDANSVSLPPMFQASMAIAWFIAFMTALLMLGRKWRYAVRYSGWLIIGFVLSRLVQTALFAQADYDRNRLTFLIIVTLLILIVPTLLLLQGREKGT